MKRPFSSSVSPAAPSNRLRRSVKSLVLASALALGLVASPTPAAAQEIQLTGPLAGAPSVRRLRLYRENRFELAVGGGLPLLSEYERTYMLAGRLQYNIVDWLGIGVFGGFGLFHDDTDLTDRINTTAPRNSRTAVNLAPKEGSPGGQNFNKQTGKMTWMVVPQLTFSPFRGKLAIFQKLFVDTDLYIHGGAAFIGLEERRACGESANTPCTFNGNPNAFAKDSRVAIAPSFGLGLTFYFANFMSLNTEYRAFPFSWNRGGFDARGTGPDAAFPDNKINDEDQTFKFNQMIFVALGFSFPTKPKISE
jgi:outer membrane beta-barrel protein